METITPKTTTETQLQAPMVWGIHGSAYNLGSILNEQVKKIIPIASGEVFAVYREKSGSEAFRKVLAYAVVVREVWLGDVDGESLLREEDFIEPLILGDNGLQFAWLKNGFEDMKRRDKLKEKNKDGENKLPNPIIETLKKWINRRVIISMGETDYEGVLTGVSYAHLNLMIRTDEGETIIFRAFSSVKLVKN